MEFKTIFLDIDGTILRHYGNLEQQLKNPVEILPGVKEKLHEWDLKGYYIILTTGRRECSRKITEKQLEDNGIFYHQLIMGIGRGPRIVINDSKPEEEQTAIAIVVKRNYGIKDVVC